MRVRLPQTMTVSEHFSLARVTANCCSPSMAPVAADRSRGSERRSAVGHVEQQWDNSNVAAVTARAPTQPAFVDPARRHQLDAKPGGDPVPHPANNTIRLGTTIVGLTGILNHSFGNYAIHAD